MRLEAKISGTRMIIFVAGLVGGMAEVAWVSLYAWFTPLDGAVVAREVTASLLSTAFAVGIAGAWLGVLIHMLLALALGYAFAYVVWKPVTRPRGLVATLAASVLTLAGVWTMNFFVVLPALNPVFITLLPYPVTFASKMLFALSMALALAWLEVRGTARNRTARLAG